MTDKPSAGQDWASELFLLVERRQGKAFISDGIEVYEPHNRAEIVRIAQQTLDLQRDLNRDLAKWIRAKKKLLAKESTNE